MQTLKDKSMIEICKEEGVSPKQVFFAFLCCWHLNTNLSVCEVQLIFCGDQDKNLVLFFTVGFIIVGYIFISVIILN